MIRNSFDDRCGRPSAHPGLWPSPAFSWWLAALLAVATFAASGGNGGSVETPTTPPSSGQAAATPIAGQATAPPSSAGATPNPAGNPTSTVEPTAASRPTARPSLAVTSAETDREALVALYNATGGESWDENGTWLSDAPIDEWEGVRTDEDGRVIELSRHTGLSGEIPSELGNLANLESLYLGRNQLSGEIPPELGNLANLERLDLGDNQLIVCVPQSLERLHAMSDLPLCGE